jgi:carbonic anhydrase
VLTCSDARVSPARLFDLPAGDLFVVRVAGNSATPEAVASLTYAVDELGADTVVVLGHSHCGAVTAALDERHDPALACLVDPIRTALDHGPRCDDLPCAVAHNVSMTVGALVADRGPLGSAIRAGRASVHGAVLDLPSNTLTDIETVPAHDSPNPVTTARSITA